VYDLTLLSAASGFGDPYESRGLWLGQSVWSYSLACRRQSQLCKQYDLRGRSRIISRRTARVEASGRHGRSTIFHTTIWATFVHTLGNTSFIISQKTGFNSLLRTAVQFFRARTFSRLEITARVFVPYSWVKGGDTLLTALRRLEMLQSALFRDKGWVLSAHFLEDALQ
jgi:hypothetical protein